MSSASGKSYKIGEACRTVDIQPYVLRYWETEFAALKAGKSQSGQRVYSEDEIVVIRRIKELLYEEGYTIAGAKKRLESELGDGDQLTLGVEPPEDEATGETAAPDGEIAATDEDRGDDEQAPEDMAAEPVTEAETASPPQEEAGAEVVGAMEEAASSQAGAAAPPLAEIEEVEEPDESGEEPAATPEAAEATGAETVPESAAVGAEEEPEEAEEDEASAPERNPIAEEPAEAAPEPSPVDTVLAQRVETLEQGVGKALTEVRELLALLRESSQDAE